MNDVMIVGAGIAGLAAARELTTAGLQVCVLEKSRGVGGRLATRRLPTPHGEVLVDHGAQYFTCRSQAFWELLMPLLEQGKVKTWFEAAPTLTSEGIVSASEAHTYPRYCCPQGMTTLAKVLVEGLSVKRETKVMELKLIQPNDPGYSTFGCPLWQATTETNEVFTARALILTAPPHQSLALLGPLAEDIDELAAVRAVQFDPCLAVIVGYHPTRQLDKLPIGLRWQDDPVIAWSAIDSSKRSHPPAPILVFHTTPQFARDHQSEDRQHLSAWVLDQATQQLHPHLSLDLREPEWFQVHYWRYAQPVNPLQSQWVGSGVPAPLILAGCWCSEGRVEGAFLSGQAAAQGLISSGWL